MKKEKDINNKTQPVKGERVPFHKKASYQKKYNPTTQLKIRKNLIKLANEAGISKIVFEYYALKMQRVDGVFKKEQFKDYFEGAYALLNGKTPSERTFFNRKSELLKQGLIIDRKHCYTLISYSHFEEMMQEKIFSILGESENNTLIKRWLKIESSDAFITDYEALILDEFRSNRTVLKRKKEKGNLIDKLKSVAHTNLTKEGISLLAEKITHIDSERYVSQKTIAVLLGKKSRHTGREIVRNNPRLNFIAEKQKISRIEGNEVFKPESITFMQDEKSWYAVKDEFAKIFRSHFKVKSFSLPIIYNSDEMCFYVYHPKELIINGK